MLRVANLTHKTESRRLTFRQLFLLLRSPRLRHTHVILKVNVLIRAFSFDPIVGQIGTKNEKKQQDFSFLGQISLTVGANLNI